MFGSKCYFLCGSLFHGMLSYIIKGENVLHAFVIVASKTCENIAKQNISTVPSLKIKKNNFNQNLINLNMYIVNFTCITL